MFKENFQIKISDKVNAKAQEKPAAADVVLKSYRNYTNLCPTWKPSPPASCRACFAEDIIKDTLASLHSTCGTESNSSTWELSGN